MSITSMMTARLRGMRHGDRNVPPERLRHLCLGEAAQAAAAAQLDDDVKGEQGQRDQPEQQQARTLEPVEREWADAGQRHSTHLSFWPPPDRRRVAASKGESW
jgi:hypothetical protein